LGSCNHTYLTDYTNKHLRSTDISCAAPGAARELLIEQFPQDLLVVIRNWESLPEALRKVIMVIVETGVSQT
jgi:hypothetical protein